MPTEDGPLLIDVPRDRACSLEPVLIPKYERRFTGFDDKIVAMLARDDDPGVVTRFFSPELRRAADGASNAWTPRLPTDLKPGVRTLRHSNATTQATFTSSVQTLKLFRTLGPKVLLMATSEASRPRAINTRPMRGMLLRASKVYQWPSR